jgi:hypothetical protein
LLTVNEKEARDLLLGVRTDVARPVGHHIRPEQQVAYREVFAHRIKAGAHLNSWRELAKQAAEAQISYSGTKTFLTIYSFYYFWKKAQHWALTL